MKPRSSCNLCRRHHRRCITRPGATRCNGCDELEEDCEFGPRFQFRPSKQVQHRIEDRESSSARRSGRSGNSSHSINGQSASRTLPSLIHSPCVSVKPFARADRRIPRQGADASLVNQKRSPRRASDATVYAACKGSFSLDLDETSLPVAATRPELVPAIDRPPKSGNQLNLSQREAYLFRTWINKISLIVSPRRM